jgi:hypothetical protein
MLLVSSYLGTSITAISDASALSSLIDQYKQMDFRTEYIQLC